MRTFHLDPVLSAVEDVKVSVYGSSRKFGSRKISDMKLQLSEGEVVGQTGSSVRGYVWRGKFYGTVTTVKEILHIEPLHQLGTLSARDKVPISQNQIRQCLIIKVIICRQSMPTFIEYSPNL